MWTWWTFFVRPPSHWIQRGHNGLAWNSCLIPKQCLYSIQVSLRRRGSPQRWELKAISLVLRLPGASAGEWRGMAKEVEVELRCLVLVTGVLGSTESDFRSNYIYIYVKHVIPICIYMYIYIPGILTFVCWIIATKPTFLFLARDRDIKW